MSLNDQKKTLRDGSCFQRHNIGIQFRRHIEIPSKVNQNRFTEELKILAPIKQAQRGMKKEKRQGKT